MLTSKLSVLQVYWAGPILASVLAAFLHCLLFKERKYLRRSSSEEENTDPIINTAEAKI